MAGLGERCGDNGSKCLDRINIDENCRIKLKPVKQNELIMNDKFDIFNEDIPIFV
jgi:hypothetical protein